MRLDTPSFYIATARGSPPFVRFTHKRSLICGGGEYPIPLELDLLDNLISKRRGKEGVLNWIELKK